MLKETVKEIVGRRVAHVVTSISTTNNLAHLFLIFEDGMNYEFYASEVIRSVTGQAHAQCQLVGETISGATMRVGRDASVVTFRGDEETEIQFTCNAELRTTGMMSKGDVHVVLKRLPDENILTHWSSDSGDDLATDVSVPDERVLEILVSLGACAVYRGSLALTHFHKPDDWQSNFVALVSGDAGSLSTAVREHPDYHPGMEIECNADLFRVLGDCTGLGYDAADLYHVYLLEPRRLRRLVAYYLLCDLLSARERQRAQQVACESLLDKAAEMLRERRYSDAAASLTRLLSLDPRNWFACILLSLAFSQLGLHDEAVCMAEQAVSIAPGASESHMTLGDALLVAHCYSEAIRAIEEATRLSPEDTHPHHALGIAYCGLGARDMAQNQAAILDDLEPGLAGKLRSLISLRQ